jgi:hypothetical protein
MHTIHRESRPPTEGVLSMPPMARSADQNPAPRDWPLAGAFGSPLRLQP